MEPAFEIGGTANAPRTPPLVRHRRGTGIGNATRFVEDPAERQATHGGVNAALPERVRPPSADLPLLVQPRDAACGDAATWGGAARALLDERLAQVGAVDKLHYNGRLAFHFRDGLDPQDVGVLQACKELRLVTGSGQYLFGVGPLLTQNLDRDDACQTICSTGARHVHAGERP